MRYIYLLIILSCLSCNNERLLHLPEIENAEVTKVLDVSPAYIFYDDTQPDSTLLNRKNLIITTNWLVNVDKRLRLEQAIPHIQFLQDKKRNAEMHKNEDAKNYFTCNDTSIGNLGFLEFTDVYYHFKETNKEAFTTDKDSISKQINPKYLNTQICELQFLALNNISLVINPETTIKLSIDNLVSFLQNEDESYSCKLQMRFSSELSFQDYITIKSKLSKIESDKIVIDTNEFIF